MKIVVNYDLLDKVREARTGFSLKRINNETMIASAIGGPLVTAHNLAMGYDNEEILFDLALIYLLNFEGRAIFRAMFSNSYKQLANEQLNALSNHLHDIFVHTDPELLQAAYRYKTKYELDSEDSKLPRLVEKKYIMVPVHNEWDCNERSLVQEHVVGSKEYVISYGEPEKKVLKLGQRQFMRK